MESIAKHQEQNNVITEARETLGKTENERKKLLIGLVLLITYKRAPE